MIKQSNEPNILSDSESQSDTFPSKSQRKRDALKAVELAKALLQLSPSRRNRFELTAEITDALTLADTIRSNGAKKRQLQFIGKLLRSSADYERYWKIYDSPKNNMVQSVEQPNEKLDLSAHLNMRDRLLENLADTMSDLRSQYPNANTQLIRQLVNRIHNSTNDTAQGGNATEAGSNSQEKLLQALTTALSDGSLRQ